MCRDGGDIVAGLTASYGAGGDDFLIIKVDSDRSMASDCPWDTCSPVITDQPLGANCSPDTSNQSLGGADCIPSTNSYNLLTSDVCGQGVEL